MENTKALKTHIQNIFASQKLAVLSTHRKGQPYASLVAFACTDDLKYLFFATTRATRKYANLTTDARVAFLIDNRSNQSADFYQASAVTAVGQAKEVQGNIHKKHLKFYLTKHPELKDFVTAPTCALLRVKVEAYFVVDRFQNVRELHIRQ